VFLDLDEPIPKFETREKIGKEVIKLKSFLMKISWFFIGAEVKYRVPLWLTNGKKKRRIS